MIDLRDISLSCHAVMDALGLSVHPEGGSFKELWRDPRRGDARGNVTSILYLLSSGERSHWHRLDAAEIWLWQAGAPMELQTFGSGRATARLGPNLTAGEALQAVVPAMIWQAARSLGAWSLVSCVVAPAFEFEGFEMAPPGWTPPVE